MYLNFIDQSRLSKIVYKVAVLNVDHHVVLYMVFFFFFTQVKKFKLWSSELLQVLKNVFYACHYLFNFIKKLKIKLFYLSSVS